MLLTPAETPIACLVKIQEVEYFFLSVENVKTSLFFPNHFKLPEILIYSETV